MRHTDFWTWQHRALGWLLGWGAASVVIGAGLAANRQPELRQVGLQAIGWGVIDAALALNGRRAARAKQQLAATTPTVERETTRFQQIVAVNAGLDLLYIIGGWRLIQTAGQRPQRRGMGIGIVVQGLFLLIYDSWLVWRVAAWCATH
jgi:hypothetical protein